MESKPGFHIEHLKYTQMYSLISLIIINDNSCGKNEQK